MKWTQWRRSLSSGEKVQILTDHGYLLIPDSIDRVVLSCFSCRCCCCYSAVLLLGLITISSWVGPASSCRKKSRCCCCWIGTFPDHWINQVELLLSCFPIEYDDAVDYKICIRNNSWVIQETGYYARLAIDDHERWRKNKKKKNSQSGVAALAISDRDQYYQLSGIALLGLALGTLSFIPFPSRMNYSWSLRRDTNADTEPPPQSSAE